MNDVENLNGVENLNDVENLKLYFNNIVKDLAPEYNASLEAYENEIKNIFKKKVTFDDWPQQEMWKDRTDDEIKEYMSRGVFHDKYLKYLEILPQVAEKISVGLGQLDNLVNSPTQQEQDATEAAKEAEKAALEAKKKAEEAAEKARIEKAEIWKMSERAHKILNYRDLAILKGT